MSDEMSVCPKCGTRTMAKVPQPDRTYLLRCESCGLTRGPLKPDRHAGVV